MNPFCKCKRTLLRLESARTDLGRVTEEDESFVHSNTIDPQRGPDNSNIPDIIIGKCFLQGTRTGSFSNSDFDEPSLFIKDKLRLSEETASHTQEGEGKHEQIGKRW